MERTETSTIFSSPRLGRRVGHRVCLTSFLVALAVVVLVCLLGALNPALASSTAPFLGFRGPTGALTQIREFLTGPTAELLGQAAMIGVLYGIVIRSSRGESISSLATVGACLLVLFSINDLLSLIGISYGAGM
jgi:type IV secretory pathway VirB2 component (pilin)